MRRSRVIVVAVVAFTLAAAACGLDQGGVLGIGESPDGSIIDGATIDGQVGDGQITDAIASGDGESKDGSPDADGSMPFDAGKPYSCFTTPVADCTTDCPGFPQLCGTICFSGCAVCSSGTYQCDACFSDGGPSVSVCEPEDAAAFASCLSGQTRCPCVNQSSCPGNSQTCTNGQCFECEEPDAGNGGSTCKNGGQCKTGTGNFGICM